MCTSYQYSHIKGSKEWLLGISEAASLSRTFLIPLRYPIIPSDTFLGGWCIWEMTALCMSETQMLRRGQGSSRYETGDNPSRSGRCECLHVNQLSVALWRSQAGYRPAGNFLEDDANAPTRNECELQWTVCCKLVGGRGAEEKKILDLNWTIIMSLEEWLHQPRLGGIPSCFILSSFAEQSSNC